NAFFASGLSLDPSFEFPRGSGHELLNHAELWVGARDASGVARVSGGPMLEWRPTLAPHDRVRKLNAGDAGSRPYFDDDHDVRMGLYADLDSRERNDPTGHLDDDASIVPFSVLINPHPDTLEGNWVKQCVETIAGEVAAVRDANHASGRPGVGLVPLSHTTDP